MAADRRASEEYTTCLGQTWSLFEEERGGALVVPRIFAGHLLEATAICERRLARTTVANWPSGIATWSVMVSMIDLLRGDVNAARERLRAVGSEALGDRHPSGQWTRQMYSRIVTWAMRKPGSLTSRR